MSKERQTGLLHVHSHYSLLAPNPAARTLAISSVEDLVSTAIAGEHQAFAITDDQMLLHLGKLFAAINNQPIKAIPGVEVPITLHQPHEKQHRLSSATILALTQPALENLIRYTNTRLENKTPLNLDEISALPYETGTTLLLRSQQPIIEDLTTIAGVYWGVDNFQPQTLHFAQKLAETGRNTVVSHQVVMSTIQEGHRYQKLKKDSLYQHYRYPQGDFDFLAHRALSSQELLQYYHSVPAALAQLESMVQNADVQAPDLSGIKALSAKERDSYQVLAEIVSASSLFEDESLADSFAQELDLIQKMSLADYLLICKEVVDFCREEQILLTASGSANNSPTAAALGITQVDPRGLYAPRFINQARGNNLPDVDFLISEDGKARVSEFLINRYGAVSLSVIHHHRQDELKVGLPEKVSRHPSGLVIFEGELPRWKIGQILADKEDVEKTFNLTKLDFPNDPAVSLLEKSLKLQDINLAEWRLDIQDEAVAQKLSQGDTLGIPYLDSPHMQQILTKIMPNEPMNIEGLAQALAIARPQRDARILFANPQWQESNPFLDYPEIKAILAETNFTLIYQEQIMRMAIEIAGESMVYANNLRKMMSEKTPLEYRLELLEDLNQKIHQRGYPPEVSQALGDQLLNFVGYGFMKGHALSLAQLTWGLAYQKEHHPLAYWTAMLQKLATKGSNSYTLQAYINELHRRGVKLDFPDFDELPDTSQMQDQSIRVGKDMLVPKNRRNSAAFRRDYENFLERFPLAQKHTSHRAGFFGNQRREFKCVISHSTDFLYPDYVIFSKQNLELKDRPVTTEIIGQLVLASRVIDNSALITLDSGQLIHTSIDLDLLKTKGAYLLNPDGSPRPGQNWYCQLTYNPTYQNWRVTKFC